MRRPITTEQLGSSTTEADVWSFNRAVRNVMLAFHNDRRLAEDYVWNDGQWTQRIDAAVCAYCGMLLPTDGSTVPAGDDDAEWQRLAPMHNAPCEWIITRAHRTFC